MGDERNDGWNHRSEMKGPRDPALKTVTANVKVRRHGEVGAFHPSGDKQGANPSGVNHRQEREEAPHRTEWEDGFEERHFSSGRYDEASDERSNREKLLDGETL